jgi:hypothetical protein
MASRSSLSTYNMHAHCKWKDFVWLPPTSRLYMKGMKSSHHDLVLTLLSSTLEGKSENLIGKKKIQSLYSNFT